MNKNNLSDLFNEKCYKSLHEYNAEKMCNLLSERFQFEKNLRPTGFLYWIKLAENDARKGRDGFNGKKIEQSPVNVLNYEKLELCESLYSKKFCEEVEELLKSLPERIK